MSALKKPPHLLDVLCKTCGARPGSPCRRIGGHPKHPCPARLRRFADVTRQWERNQQRLAAWEKP